MHLDINVWLFVRLLCVQPTKCWYKKPSDEDGRVQRVKPLYDDEIEPRFFFFVFFFLSFFFVFSSLLLLRLSWRRNVSATCRLCFHCRYNG